jgi:hypothetical protein
MLTAVPGTLVGVGGMAIALIEPDIISAGVNNPNESFSNVCANLIDPGKYLVWVDLIFSLDERSLSNKRNCQSNLQSVKNQYFLSKIRHQEDYPILVLQLMTDFHSYD